MSAEIPVRRVISSRLLIILSFIFIVVSPVANQGFQITATPVADEVKLDSPLLFPEWSPAHVLSDTLAARTSRPSRYGDRGVARDPDTGNYYAVFSSLGYTDESGCMVSFCRSTDGGRTFETTYVFPEVCPLVDGWETVVACRSGLITVAFAARTSMVSWEQRVYLSRDSGESFEKIYDDNEWYELGPSLVIDEELNFHLTLFNTGSTGSIYYYRSTNLGESWQLDDSIIRGGTTTLATWEDELYLAYRRSGVWTDSLKFIYSPDHGESWSDPEVLQIIDGYGRYMSLASDGEGGLHIAWLEEESSMDHIWTFYSSDSGRSWTGGNVPAEASDLSRVSISAEGSKVGIVSSLHESAVKADWFTWNLYFCGSTDHGTTWGNPVRVNSFMAKGSASFPHLLISGGRALTIYPDGLQRGKSCIYPVVSSLADPFDPDYLRFSWDEFSFQYKYSYVYAPKGERIDLPFHVANYTSNTKEADIWIEIHYLGEPIEIYSSEGVTLEPGENLSMELSNRLVPPNMIPGMYTITGFIGDIGTGARWDLDQFSVWVE